MLSAYITYAAVLNMYYILWVGTIKPKARGLVQNGGPPGWMEETDPAGVILYVMDGPYCLPFPYGTRCALTGAAQLWADGIFQLLLCSKCTKPSVMSYSSRRKAWPGALPYPCLLSRELWELYLLAQHTQTDIDSLAGGYRGGRVSGRWGSR